VTGRIVESFRRTADRFPWFTPSDSSRLARFGAGILFEKT